MKSTALLLAILAGVIFLSARAQVPQETQAQHTSMNFYRDTPDGKKLLDFVVTGSSVSNLLVQQFQLKSFRAGDPNQTQIIAQAPQCQIYMSNGANIKASDAGPLKLFTPKTNGMTNLFIRGVGFRFTQGNHLLIISNQVETRVRKSLMKSAALAAPRTNEVADTNLTLIYAHSGRFDLDSNVVDYAGSVHVIDPQLDLTCELLTIRFTTNSAVESILARQNVVLTTTNNGRATGATGFYYVTNGNEMMQLTTDAAWRNGDQEAKANEFIYDSTRHFLTGIGHVWVRWPNATQNPPGSATNLSGLLAGTNGFRDLYADFATLQFPTNKGPVESMRARGNVITVNQADQSRSMSEQLVYEKSTDRVELTGSPVWWNDDMEVKAELLLAELGDKVYHARTNAHFKMRTGASTTNHPAAASGQNTNQWLYISSDDMEYRTNQATFFRNVETRQVQSNLVQDTLRCVLLTVNLTNNQMESATARDKVHGETAPDPSGVIKTIDCVLLNAYRSIKTGLWKSFDAHTNVVIEEIGTHPGAPRNKLSADTVTAQFSAVTNEIEKAVAVRNVVLDQFKAGKNTHATSKLAVYTAANDQVKLTGVPLAHNDNSLITNADYMIWKPKANEFQSFGLYKILPYPPAAGQNKPATGEIKPAADANKLTAGPK